MEITIKFKDEDIHDVDYHLHGKKAFYALNSIREEARRQRRQHEKADNAVAEVFWSEFIDMIDEEIYKYELTSLIEKDW